ncbi:GNAT family N-acetyltransferase [Bifidobacterium sp. SMB2]|uniref:GNAT family N-acetyltransferase n=1 Tax=Bifidobacterium saimiriisciurei TaxID=2661627 RepID=A0ABX0CGZ4_9BIFI|nr:GNAT family N-acetyltransferase [Bifidobacterium sp. SMB2]NEH11582.1 GNAT family N-acetyltransferase [Bifidobacterium saimiriisciurei]
MELTIKRFEELTAAELYEIYRVRVAVFVVEQECAYQEVDDADRRCWHVFLHDDDGIAAYCRVIDAGVTFDETSIGRVLSLRRGRGLGTRIVEAGLDVARTRAKATVVHIEAQTHARGMYERLGFVQVSDEFLEDGIPHIGMMWHAGAVADRRG